MDERVLKWLWDARKAAEHIGGFLEQRGFSEHQTNILLRSAVERQFEILGEAIKRIRDSGGDTIESIEGWRGAISFRNILAHGYDSVDDAVVWDVIQTGLPKLSVSVRAILDAES